MRLPDLESRVFLFLVLATSALFLWMVRSFLLPVFWAAVFGVLFQPLFVRLNQQLRGRRSLAALGATLAVVLVVLIPFGFLIGALAQQALGLYQRIAAGEVDLQGPIGYVERTLPTLTLFLAQYGVEIGQLRAAVQNAAVFGTQFIAGRALALGQNLLAAAIFFFLMLYLLFFCFRDGDRIVAGIIRAIPMGDEREARLLSKFAEVSRATVKGTLVVAVVQGMLGGVLFWIVGIQAALFWGVMMGILSLLPAVGPALVWFPAAVILFATGGIWQGLVVIGGGTLVVGLVDNVLRPVLVGRETQMPDYLVLLATLGGLSVFGLAGFVAGPIVAALFLVMWEMFADEYAPLDTSLRPTVAPPASAVPGEPAPQPVRIEEEPVEQPVDVRPS